MSDTPNPETPNADNPIQQADESNPRRRLWADRLQRFDQTDLTLAEFCRREGVSVQTFYYWKNKLRPAAPTRHAQPLDAADFLPLSLPSGGATLDILLPGGAILKLQADSDLRLVANLLRALGEPSC
jgi:hypothetical protein